MTIRFSAIVLLVSSAVNIEAAQQTAVLRSSRYTPSAQELETLESYVQQKPDDIPARVKLLNFYLDIAPIPPNDDPGRRAIRLQHILFLVEHFPDAAPNVWRPAFVSGADGPYANAADHAAVRSEWLAAVQSHPRNSSVTMNAVRFLEREDTEDAEQVLRRAVNDEPDNREIAANLGFLYAKEILGTGAGLGGHARTELQESTNAVVLAAAGTALPNLAMRATAGRVVDPVIFDFANELAERARQLAPDDPDIQGPMPLIKYFSESQNDPVAPPLPLQLPANVPTRIRVSGNVQAANLIHKTVPLYPDQARNAGISGEVRMSAIIGRDGTIQHLEFISGHPLLVQAALDAALTWVYKPTLLNGAPVEVDTTITVSFPPN